MIMYYGPSRVHCIKPEGRDHLGFIVSNQKEESIYIKRVNLRELATLRGKTSVIILNMRGSRQFCQRGSSSNIFLVDEAWGREDQNTIKRGSLLARQQNAI